MDKEIEQEILALSTLILLEPENALALYRRGSLYWKLERHAEAITDFNASAKLDPKGPGAAAAAHAQAILDFFNPQNP